MRTSEVLSRLASEPGERLSVAGIVSVLSDRAFALLIVLLGLPNCIPMPPPIPLICSLLLIVVAVQIGLGYRAPWMPGFLLRRSVARADIARAVGRALPLVLRLERLSKPRFVWAGSPLSTILTALVVVILALGLLTAAPFVGQIPWGIAVCLVGLGLVERDGVLVGLGLVVGCLGLFISAGFIYAIFLTLRSWF